MTDPEGPLSRRERRMRAQRASESEFDDLATSQTAAIGHDGRPLTRRERRALERTQRPMETWTAEEEMLATGQLPAMTPEVVAQEERLARERAEQAARDAEATSAELQRVAPHDVAPDADAVEVEDAAAQVAEDQYGAAAWPEPESEPSAEHQVWPPMATESARPFHVEWPEPQAEASPGSPADEDDAGIVEDYSALADSEPTPADDAPSRMPFTGLSRQHVEPDAEVAAAPEEPSVDERPVRGPVPTDSTADDAEPAAMQDSQAEASAEAEALPASLLSLFPPGSPQARMMEEGAAYARAQAAAPKTPAAPAPPLDFTPGDVTEEESSAAGEDTVTADAEDRSLEQVFAEMRHAAPAIDVATVGDAARAAGEAVAESHGEPAPHDRELPDGVFHDASSDAHDEGGAQTLPPLAPFGLVPAGASRDDGDASHAPSIWESHPLMIGPEPAFDPDAHVASTSIPLPDLAALEAAAHPTATGGQGEPAQPFVAGPVTDGIEVPRREVPQLEPGQGARDMHWAHFLVIGAVAFVLGLLVYQLGGFGS